MISRNPRSATSETATLRPVPARKRDMWQGFLLSEDERLRLDQMLGSALLDDDFCIRLVFKRDPVLMTSFGLSDETQQWITAMRAGSLEELAQEIALFS